MRYFLVLLASLFSFAGTGNAQVTGLNVGYCDGRVNTSGTSGFSSSEKDTWISGAIYIPKSMLKTYAGNRIDVVNAGMASALNVDTVTVWVRSTLDGEDIARGGISKNTVQKIVKGWNPVRLEKPYDIQAESEGVYVGLSFHQTGSSMGLSVNPAPHENALFVKMGSGAEWTDRSSEGSLALEAMVYGDNLPRHNLVLEAIRVQPVFVVDKGTLSVSATLRNVATHTVTGFDIECVVDGSTDVYRAHVDESIAYNERKTVNAVLDITGITGGDPKTRTATITVTNLNEGEDENMEDNVLAADFEVVEHDFTRNILLEEFTGESCPNCPRVAGFLENIFEDKDNGYKERVNVICHHSGHNPDWLTQPADKAYLWFYNDGGSTYAPAVMFDRYAGEFVSSPSTPVVLPLSEEYIMWVFDDRLLDPAFVSLKIRAEMDSEDAGKVRVTVGGERSKADFTMNPPRINVVLVEDGIKAHNQANGGPDYVHNHVARAQNSTWGDVLEWTGDSYEYSCELNVGRDCVRENLSIVAYIWDYDQNDASGCKVANSSRIGYADFDVAAGVEINTADDSMLPVEYYSCDGMSLSAPRKGLNIVRMENGKTGKVMIR